jgi:hypothetical protein
MYEPFKKYFAELEIKENSKEDLALFEQLPQQLFCLFSELGGKSFERGLYKIHKVTSSIRWSLKIESYYTTYKKKVYPFGYDWLGRQFCVSSEDSSHLLMFDPATGEYFTLEQDLIGFHNSDLVNDKDEMVSRNLFSETLKNLQLSAIGFDDCIGHTIPLFLEGEDVISNLERQNILKMEFMNYVRKRNLYQQLPVYSIYLLYGSEIYKHFT